MEDFIQLKKSNIIKVKINDENGNYTGNNLEFDLEDIELPLRYQEMMELHKKNANYVQHQFIIIDKRQDIKGKKLLSRNEEEKIKILNEFYRREMEALDLFLGKGGTNKLLNGRKPYINMFEDISETIEPLAEVFNENLKESKKRIKEKYKMQESNILKNE